MNLLFIGCGPVSESGKHLKEVQSNIKINEISEKIYRKKKERNSEKIR